VQTCGVNSSDEARFDISLSILVGWACMCVYNREEPGLVQTCGVNSSYEARFDYLVPNDWVSIFIFAESYY
jgi:hypothetical protein